MSHEIGMHLFWPVATSYLLPLLLIPFSCALSDSHSPKFPPLHANSAPLCFNNQFALHFYFLHSHKISGHQFMNDQLLISSYVTFFPHFDRDGTEVAKLFFFGKNIQFYTQIKQEL